MKNGLLELLAVLLFIPVLGVGCGKEGINKTIAPVRNFINEIKDEAKGAYETAGDKYGKSLGEEGKAVIDEWLEKNQLNEFGDNLGTLYTGGTPLFDELTGQATDRFEYLLKKFPELRDVISRELSQDK